ncbi:carbonic anhydrase [Mycena galopus ATCC 62051]|nr:carbonic anhydrase [Mycena galopus ATCC 62051]
MYSACSCSCSNTPSNIIVTSKSSLRKSRWCHRRDHSSRSSKIPTARACNLLFAPSSYRATLCTTARRDRDFEQFALHKAKTQSEKPVGVPPKLPIALPPTKRLAIVTCMDARINPFKQLGISEGEAHLIRNAGGMAKDALRSLIISQRLLGTREIAIYHHTGQHYTTSSSDINTQGCGMITFRGSELKQLVKWANPDNAACATQIDAIDFLEFTDLEQSVRDDVMFLRESPLILKGTRITGWIHHLENGETTRVI